MTRRSSVAWALLAVAGCAATPDRLTVPPLPPDTAHIDTARFEDADDMVPVEFTADPVRINGLIGFLGGHREDWTVRGGAFPKPVRTVTFFDGRIDVLELYIGPDWVGGREATGAFTAKRYRPLSPGERAELQRLLDATP